LRGIAQDHQVEVCRRWVFFFQAKILIRCSGRIMIVRNPANLLRMFKAFMFTTRQTRSALLTSQHPEFLSLSLSLSLLFWLIQGYLHFMVVLGGAFAFCFHMLNYRSGWEHRIGLFYGTLHFFSRRSKQVTAWRLFVVRVGKS
jgi:hypothetical protein